MSAQMLFFYGLFEKDPHLNANEKAENSIFLKFYWHHFLSLVAIKQVTYLQLLLNIIKLCESVWCIQMQDVQHRNTFQLHLSFYGAHILIQLNEKTILCHNYKGKLLLAITVLLLFSLTKNRTYTQLFLFQYLVWPAFEIPTKQLIVIQQGAYIDS